MHILIFSYVTKIGLLIFRKEGQYYHYYFNNIPVAEQPNCDICNSIPQNNGLLCYITNSKSKTFLPSYNTCHSRPHEKNIWSSKQEIPTNITF